MGYKVKRIMMRPNGVEKQVRPVIPPLCFIANTGGSTISLNKNGDPTAVTLETSTDGTNWSTYTIGTTITLSSAGDRVYFRNASETPTGFSIGTSDCYQFSMSGSIAGVGNINYLLCKEGCIEMGAATFSRLFFNCASLTSSPALPSTSIPGGGYTQMFFSCNGLTEPPELPATSMGTWGYYQMFLNCANLKSSPEIHISTVSTNGLGGMFKGCSSLKTAPSILPATTLAAQCYSDMFNGCSSLKTVPILPATTLTSSCYSAMFTGCTSLTICPELPATTLAQNCYNQMFNGCTNLQSLPLLPATTLADSCYNWMFSGCTNILLSTSQTGNYQTAYRIPTTGTGIEGTYSLNNMFQGTGGTFTGTPSINTTYYTANTVA